MIKRILLFSTSTLLALGLGFCLPEQWLTPAFYYTGYYFMLLAFVFWGALILDVLNNSLLSHLKQHVSALFIAIILMILVFHISPPKFKILADETNLVSVSMAMHQNKTASMLFQGMAVEYYPFDYDQMVDQRPLLYPFVISLFHAFFGYSPFNGMAANFVAGIGILFAFYLLFFHMFSKFYGIAAMIITASFPIFIFWVTSSGFETINLLFIVIVLLVLILFLKNKDVKKDVKYAEIVLFSLVLLANCRYESIIFFFSLIILTPYFLNKNIIAKYRFPAFCIPLFFLPLAWQRQIIFFNPSVWSPDGVKTPEHAFGVVNFLQNFSQNLFALTGMDADFGFLFLIFITAVAGMYLAGKKFLLNPDSISPAGKAFGLYLSLSGVLIFVFYTAFFWGQFTTDIDNRLAMSLLPFFIIPAVYCLYRMPYFKFLTAKSILLFFLLIQMLYYWPIASKHYILQQNNFYYINDRITQYLYKNYEMENDKLLLISDRPNFYIIHGIGSIGFKKALMQQKKLQYLDNVYYDKTLVLQKCHPITNKVEKTHRLNNGFQLKEKARINISPEYYYRISEIISYKFK